ncbi:MAG: hypothetical protein QTN59_06250 [Candidatus Electrothrix communis]|nr:MAG: hypothetical protein QTN59_06250 [Candidatus Electrothrix communis]
MPALVEPAGMVDHTGTVVITGRTQGSAPYRIPGNHPDPCIIVIAQTNGTAMMNVRVIWHGCLLFHGVVGAGPRACPGGTCQDGGSYRDRGNYRADTGIRTLPNSG